MPTTPKKGQKVFLCFLTLTDMRGIKARKECPRAEVREVVFDHTCNPSWCNGELRWACGKNYFTGYKPEKVYMTRAAATAALDNQITAFIEKLNTLTICQS